jgi:hypothetical protein
MYGMDGNIKSGWVVIYIRGLVVESAITSSALYRPIPYPGRFVPSSSSSTSAWKLARNVRSKLPKHCYIALAIASQHESTRYDNDIPVYIHVLARPITVAIPFSYRYKAKEVHSLV